MSYILDALRRAEAERDRGSLPGLNTPAGVPVYVDRRLLGRGNPWLWLLAGMVGAVLLVMGLRLWWNWATADAVPGAEVAAQAPAVVPAAALPLAPAAVGTGGVARAEAGAPGLASVPAGGDRAAALMAAVASAVTVAVPVKAVAAGASVPTAATASGLAGSPPTGAPVAPSNAPPIAAPDGRIHAPADLPPEIARELPNLVFGGLIQLEDPPRRSLIINGVIYMEGESVQPDLVLEQIRLNAAVLRYKGHRYQLPI